MVCKVGGERRIPNFNFLANAFTAYSTVKFIGLMDQNMVIKQEDVYFRDVCLDDPDYELPEDAFEVRARMVLGFRQIDSERWPASSLYVLDFEKRAKEALAKADRGEPAVLQVRLKKDRRAAGRALRDRRSNIRAEYLDQPARHYPEAEHTQLRRDGRDKLLARHRQRHPMSGGVS